MSNLLYADPLAELYCGDAMDWRGLYHRDYDLVTAESYAHPAKAAWDLAFRIIKHLEELGLLKAGATVVDPMMGTGRFLIAACAKGYKAVGVELEPKFLEMCQANKEYAGRKLGRVLDWEIIQGDARNLSGLLGERGLVAVSSPPYLFDMANTPAHKAPDGHDSGFMKTKNRLRHYIRQEGYGDTPGQIGKLPDKPLVITSPPYEDSEVCSGNQDIGKRKERRARGDWKGYGASPGQIGDTCAITSPPYEDSDVDGARHAPEGYFDRVGGIGHTRTVDAKAENQIGQERGPTYLSAMAQVYAEVAKVADVLVVVVKNPTRNGKLRRLDLDTIALLEATGWRINCIHHAILFDEVKQGGFDGSQKRVKGRMSFFKRLAWQKGSPVADHEDVIVSVKRLTGT